jgi:hypothetical protein
MIYLAAIFIPPLYFLIKKKWAAFIVTSLLFILSLFLAMTVVLLPATFVLWFLSAIVAVWDLRKSVMNEHAELLATKMAEKMQKS